MNQPIQENKEEYNGYKKIDGCYMCERYEKHWHDKVVSSQSKAPQNTSREEKPIKEFIANLLASRDAALLEFIESTKTKYPIDSRKISSTEIAINWANPLAHEVLDLVASHIRHDL